MADFVAVLRKTINGLADNGPTMRAKVYDKARATVEAKLAAIDPAPPVAVAERQRQALENAIRSVEASFTPPETDAFDELEQMLTSSGKASDRPETRPTAAQYHAGPEAADPPESAVESPGWSDHRPERIEDDYPPDRAVMSFDGEDAGAEQNDYHEPARRRRAMPIVLTILVLSLIGGAAYALWLNRDELLAMVRMAQMTASAPPVQEAAAPQTGDSASAPGEATVAALEPPEPPASTGVPDTGIPDTGVQDTGIPEPGAQETPGAAAPPAEPQEVEKFTQRLNTDGSEVDEGSSGGIPSVGEGTSVAAVTQPPANAAPAPAAPTDAIIPPGPQPPAPNIPPGPQPPTPNAVASEGTAAVAVGQKAIFYEERTNVAEGSAESGSVVWSLVQESPGNDLPPEPAIRGEATIPGKDIQLRMTIRRNADKTLPASHIIELIFLTPDNFEGGGIENILRFALKDTEAAAGSPVLGIPAKIADGFFLVALNDTKAEVETNLGMLRRERWIDVPLVYKSGRRALMTMEKGVPGDKVFDEAVKAWLTATASAG